MLSFFNVFLVCIKTRAYLFFEEIRVNLKFYKNRDFRSIDRALSRRYFFSNPYRISKKFLQERGAANFHTYGETPLTTLALIAKECGITDQDRFFDLGCGRGRGVFFFSHIIGCEAFGVDWISEFISHAIDISNRFHSRAQFFCQNIIQTELREGDVIYLCGTCLEDQLIKDLISSLPKGIKMITISYPLSDYDDERFNMIKEFEVSFPWGKTKAYLQEI